MSQVKFSTVAGCSASVLLSFSLHCCCAMQNILLRKNTNNMKWNNFQSQQRPSARNSTIQNHNYSAWWWKSFFFVVVVVFCLYICNCALDTYTKVIEHSTNFYAIASDQRHTKCVHFNKKNVQWKSGKQCEQRRRQQQQQQKNG